MQAQCASGEALRPFGVGPAPSAPTDNAPPGHRVRDQATVLQEDDDEDTGTET